MYLTMIEELTRANVIKINLAGAATVATCIVCGKSIEFAQKDEFTPFSEERYTATGRRITVKFKTNKAYLKDFLETHYGLHKRENCYLIK